MRIDPPFCVYVLLAQVHRIDLRITFQLHVHIRTPAVHNPLETIDRRSHGHPHTQDKFPILCNSLELDGGHRVKQGWVTRDVNDVSFDRDDGLWPYALDRPIVSHT